MLALRYTSTKSIFPLWSNPATNWWPNTSLNFSGHSALILSSSFVYSTILCPLYLKLNTKLRKRVWSTFFRGVNANWERNASSNTCQLACISALRSWYQRRALFRNYIQNMIRVAVSFLVLLVYIWPSTAKLKFSMNSAGFSCPSSSFTSRPNKWGIRSLKEVPMLLGGDPNSRRKEPGVGSWLWLLDSLWCNVVIMFANSATEKRFTDA